MSDYWDIDRIIYEDHPLTCIFVTQASAIGWLDPFIRHRGLPDVCYLFTCALLASPRHQI